MEGMQYISSIVSIITLPLCVFFLKGIYDEVKQNTKNINELDKRVSVLEAKK